MIEVEVLRWLAVLLCVTALLVLVLGRKLPWGGHLSPVEREKVADDVVSAADGSREKATKLVEAAVKREYRIRRGSGAASTATNYQEFVQAAEKAAGNVAPALRAISEPDLRAILKRINPRSPEA